jgi:TonB-linked SusC/RagA family outer membrane protein
MRRNVYKTLESFLGSSVCQQWHKRFAVLVVLISVISSAVLAQDLSVTGKVVDGQGTGIPGATVLEKGTQNGVITDFEGNFKIAVNANSVLVISFVGFKTQEITVGSQTNLQITLSEDVAELGEIVVIGYGSVEKEDVTGVVSSVDEEEFNKGIIGSPDKLLTGKVAGMQIASGGEPGSATQVRIRGTSINGQNPLYVVDGVPLSDGGVAGGRNPLNFMNPSDVENVVVLKDASAAAIYGSRGANGVILITTKTGSSGKMRISYDGNYTMSKFVQDFPNLSTANFVKAIDAKAPDYLSTLGEANTDWVDAVLQLAQGTQHNIAVSGGTAKSNYYGSVNYLWTEGIMRNTANQNLSLSFKYNQKLLNDDLTLRITTKNGWTKDQFAPNVIWSALRFDPTRPINYVEDGYSRSVDIGGYFQWADGLATPNPVASQDLNDQQGRTFRTLSNFELEYNLPFVEGLSFKANIGYDRNAGTYHGFTSEFEKGNYTNQRGASLRDEENIRTSLVQEYYGKYETNIGANSKIDATLGYSWQNFRSDFYWVAGDSAQVLTDENQSNYFWQVGELGATKDVKYDTVGVENRLISFFGRVNLDIAGRYLLTASLRRDGSTRFGDANKWGWFPSAAVGWRILDESFAKSWQNVFSELKFRVGYGITGNQEIPDYKYATFYRYSQDDASYRFGNEFVNTLRPVGVDPNIKWEETNSTNFGMDAGVLDGRLQFSLEYYIKNVNDLLFEIAVPAGSNLSDRVLTNIGQVQNTGFELTLNSVAIDRDNFKWNLGFNIATNENKVIKLDNSNDPTFGGYPAGGIAGDVGQTIQVLKEGEAAFAFHTYQHKLDANGNPVTDPNGDGVQSLLEMYVDQITEDTDGDGIPDSPDGIINEKDLVVGPSSTPKVLMGLTSNMSYKSWDLTFTLRSSLGNYTYNNTSSTAGHFEQLTERNITNNIHESAFETNFKTKQLKSDYYVENASFLKLDNITLGYNFNNVQWARLRAYVTAQNVFTLTPYSGLEPEQFNGIDNNPYPRSLSLLVGVNVQF